MSTRFRRGIEASRDVFSHTVRSLRRSPGLFLTIVTVFALGIGANAAMFETLDRILLRPPPHVDDASAVQRIHIHQLSPISQELYLGEYMSHPDFEDFRDMRTLDAVAAYATRKITLGQRSGASQVQALLASGEYWSVIGGARPALGRLFGPEDDRPGAEPVAVIGYRLWRSRFGGSPDVLGEALDFGHGPYTIVGVAPRGLTTLDLEPVDVVLPFEPAARHLYGEGWVGNRHWHMPRAIGRLAPGATPAAMEAEATIRHQAGRSETIERGQYDPDARVIAGSVIAARGPLVPDEARVAAWLGGVAVIVLLIAAVNVANLLLARNIRLRREVAVRLALGISRRRLVAQQVFEGMLLGAAGGIAAIAVDRFAGAALRTTLLPNVAWQDLGAPVDLWLALIVLAVVAGGLSALPTAIRSARSDLTEGLKSSGAGTPVRARRARAMLSVAQASLSVLLLVGAGLFLRSMHEVRTQDLGFQIDGLYEIRLLTEAGTVETQERVGLLTDAADHLRRIPGVTGAATATGNPFRNSMAVGLHIPGIDSIPRATTGGPYVVSVGEDYFRTLGINPIRGRGLETSDHTSGRRVAVVGATMARRVWAGEDPIGRCLHVGGSDEPCWRVVGIAADPRRSTLVDEAETFQYWIPAESIEMLFLQPSVLTVRLARRDVVETIRGELLGIDPRVSFVETVSIREALDPQLRSWTLGATLFSIFGGLALVVAALGLYSVIAFDVVQRTKEIGIRAALGATRRRVVQGVLNRALRLGLLGVALGLTAAAVFAPRLSHLLYGVSPHDPVTFGVVAAGLILISCCAAFLPARRAATVDPMIALRAE